MNQNKAEYVGGMKSGVLLARLVIVPGAFRVPLTGRCKSAANRTNVNGKHVHKAG